jgi:3-deoxy-D-manno-octulosonate 8-phosphate phosphatase (KDO 8-P phosphatase)
MDTTTGESLDGQLRKRAATIRLAVFDVDGTLTDGRLWFNAGGEETKAFHVHDGQGLRLLEDNGITVALITARDSAASRARANDLRLSYVFTGVKDKRACLGTLCEKLGVERAEVAYLGDDLPDLAAFDHAGLFAAPADAHPWVRERAQFVTRQRGGEGAARELCDLILEARGLKAAVLARFTVR